MSKQFLNRGKFQGSNPIYMFYEEYNKRERERERERERDVSAYDFHINREQ